MKTTADYIDLLKEKLDVDSDFLAMSAVGVNHRQQVSRYRKMHGTFDETLSAKIADTLEIDREEIFLDMKIQQEKNEEFKKVWQRIAAAFTSKHTTGLAAALALVAILPFIHLPATGLIPASGAFDNNGFYASQNIHYASLCIGLLFIVIIALLAFPKAKHDDSPSR